MKNQLILLIAELNQEIEKEMGYSKDALRENRYNDSDLFNALVSHKQYIVDRLTAIMNENDPI